MDDFDRLINDLESLTNNLLASSVEESYKLGKKILKSSDSLVPRSTETLANSQFIKKEGNVVTLGYGGENDKVNPKTGKQASEYMIKVHEDLSFKHENGGQAKFLELPFLEEIDNLGNEFGRRIVENAIKKSNN